MSKYKYKPSKRHLKYALAWKEREEALRPKPPKPVPPKTEPTRSLRAELTALDNRLKAIIREP